MSSRSNNQRTRSGGDGARPGSYRSPSRTSNGNTIENIRSRTKSLSEEVELMREDLEMKENLFQEPSRAPSRSSSPTYMVVSKQTRRSRSSSPQVSKLPSVLAMSSEVQPDRNSSIEVVREEGITSGNRQILSQIEENNYGASDSSVEMLRDSQEKSIAKITAMSERQGRRSGSSISKRRTLPSAEVLMGGGFDEEDIEQIISETARKNLKPMTCVPEAEMESKDVYIDQEKSSLSKVASEVFGNSSASVGRMSYSSKSRHSSSPNSERKSHKSGEVVTVFGDQYAEPEFSKGGKSHRSSRSYMSISEMKNTPGIRYEGSPEGIVSMWGPKTEESVVGSLSRRLSEYVFAGGNY